MRIQFWKDSLETIYETEKSKKSVPKHPVIIELKVMKNNRFKIFKEFVELIWIFCRFHLGYAITLTQVDQGQKNYHVSTENDIHYCYHLVNAVVLNLF